MNSFLIESNLYELLQYLCNVGIADCKYYNDGKLTGVSSGTSAWPHLTVNKNNDIEIADIAQLPGLIQNENYPPLLLLGNGCEDFDDVLTNKGFRKISYWTNMYLDMSLTDYTLRNEVEIRELLPGDIDSWINVVTEVLFTGKSLDKQIFIKGQENGRMKIFCAYIDTIPVGTLMVFFGKYPGIYMVAVDKHYRKKGVASELIGHTVAYLKQKGYDTLVLHSTVEGYPFYKSLGFEETGKINLHYYINKR